MDLFNIKKENVRKSMKDNKREKLFRVILSICEIIGGIILIYLGVNMAIWVISSL